MSTIAHIATAPARATLEQSRDTARNQHRDQERGRMTLARNVQQLRMRWAAEGGPGGDFTRWLGGESGEHIPHGTVQDLLRAGEALERGINVSTLTEAVNAGRKLREAVESGQTVAEALPQIQEAADEGKLRRARNPKAPEGCTTAYLPVVAADELDALRGRMIAISTRHQLDLPKTAPELLATLVEALAGLPDDGLAALLGGGEYQLALVPRGEALQELMRRAGVE